MTGRTLLHSEFNSDSRIPEALKRWNKRSFLAYAVANRPSAIVEQSHPVAGGARSN